MKPGIYSDVTNAEYHGGEGVSNSGLSLIRRSPLHYRARKLAANDNHESTAAQAIGTAFHMLLLEPQEFVKTYTLGLRQSDFPEAIDSRDKLVAMVEELNKTRLPKLSTTGTKDDLVARILDALDERSRTPEVIAEFQAMKATELKANIEELNKARQGLLSVSGTIPQLAAMLRAEGLKFQLWDEIKAEWMANNGHRNVLTPEEWDQLHNMRAAVMAHPAASRLLALPGKAEQSVYWIDQQTGVLCRCRPDFWAQEAAIVVDVKTTEDASEDAFKNSIGRYGYDTQDAMYNDGIQEATGKPLKAFVFLAVEKTACVVEGQAKGVAVYRLKDEARQLGRAKYRADLAVYAKCEETGHWPGYGTGVIQEIDLPNWQYAQNAHLFEQVA